MICKCEFCGAEHREEDMARRHNLKGFYYVCWQCQQKGSRQVDEMKVAAAKKLNREKLNKTK